MQESIVLGSSPMDSDLISHRGILRDLQFLIIFEPILKHMLLVILRCRLKETAWMSLNEHESVVLSK